MEAAARSETRAATMPLATNAPDFTSASSRRKEGTPLGCLLPSPQVSLVGTQVCRRANKTRARASEEARGRSAMAQAEAGCSVGIDRTLRPVETGVCLVGRDFGLMRQRNRTTDASMWLRNDLCAGLFRCCGVHVLCTMPADARRPTICRCKQTDSADLRPFETRASSCELVVRHCARPLACLPSESPLNMCSHRRRSGVSEGPADSARRTAASILFHERATAIHHREAACGSPEAAMAPFAPPPARRYIAEQTGLRWSKENDRSKEI